MQRQIRLRYCLKTRSTLATSYTSLRKVINRMVSHLGSSLDQSWKGLLRAEHRLETRYGTDRVARLHGYSLTRKRQVKRPQTSGGVYFGGILNNRNDPGRPSKRPSLNLSKSPSGQADSLFKPLHSPALLDSAFFQSYHSTRPTSQPPSRKPRKRAIPGNYKGSSACDFSLWTAVAIYMRSSQKGMRTSCPEKLLGRGGKTEGGKKEIRAVVNMPVFKWMETGEEEV